MTETVKQKSPTILDTNRPGLTLVEMVSLSDDKAYFDLQNQNLEYWKEFGNTIDDTEEDVTKRRQEQSDGRFGIWHYGKLVGMVGVKAKGDEKTEAEIGVLLDKGAASHGYASSAVQALTKYVEPNYERVFAEVAPDNERSINMLKRAGYVATGEVVERYWGEALVFDASK